ncbi:epidermal growth factor receptor-like [Planoprotostelium fungivorum]|uniref:Epidermal growth factor receptor-like n=1 Tax=Planoprotostelium fungivorum TaxID=1890364 RepID=A0A2P6NMB7_9EUKA|nr:epidermal growth factor receptor-like [Planoprotostelium fungivorum]
MKDPVHPAARLGRTDELILHPMPQTIISFSDRGIKSYYRLRRNVSLIYLDTKNAEERNSIGVHQRAEVESKRVTSQSPPQLTYGMVRLVPTLFTLLAFIVTASVANVYTIQSHADIPTVWSQAISASDKNIVLSVVAPLSASQLTTYVLKGGNTQAVSLTADSIMSINNVALVFGSVTSLNITNLSFTSNATVNGAILSLTTPIISLGNCIFRNILATNVINTTATFSRIYDSQFSGNNVSHVVYFGSVGAIDVSGLEMDNNTAKLSLLYTANGGTTYSITSSSFTSNSVAYGGNQGVINRKNYVSLTVTSCNFTTNDCSRLISGTFTQFWSITDCIFDRNTADVDILSTQIPSTGPLNITRSTFISNDAPRILWLQNSNAHLRVMDSSFHDAVRTGLVVNSSLVLLDNVVVTGGNGMSFLSAIAGGSHANVTRCRFVDMDNTAIATINFTLTYVSDTLFLNSRSSGPLVGAYSGSGTTGTTILQNVTGLNSYSTSSPLFFTQSSTVSLVDCHFYNVLNSLQFDPTRTGSIPETSTATSVLTCDAPSLLVTVSGCHFENVTAASGAVAVSDNIQTAYIIGNTFLSSTGVMILVWKSAIPINRPDLIITDCLFQNIFSYSYAHIYVFSDSTLNSVTVRNVRFESCVADRHSLGLYGRISQISVTQSSYVNGRGSPFYSGSNSNVDLEGLNVTNVTQTGTSDGLITLSATSSSRVSISDVSIYNSKGQTCALQIKQSKSQTANRIFLSNVTVQGFTTVLGAGILCTDALVDTLDVAGCSFGPSNTNAFVISPSASLGMVTLTNTVLTGNLANDGAGVMVSQLSNMSFYNVTVSENVAAQRGGGLSVLGTLQSLSIYNSSFLNNRAVSGGAILYSTTCSTCNVLVVDTIVDTNPANFGSFFYEGSIGQISLVNSNFKNNVVGGAVVMLSGTYVQLSVNSTVFEQNSGGAIAGVKFSSGSTISTYASTFRANTGSNGAAVALQGSLQQLVVISTSFLGNSATAGGSIWVSGATLNTLSVFNSTFQNNRASNGASLYVSTQTNVKISQSLLANNTATGNGGALSSIFPATIFLENVVLLYNSAAKGAGIYSNSPSVNVIASKFQSNIATSEGGAIHLDTAGNSRRRDVAFADISDSDFDGNRAVRGGVMMLYQNAQVTSSSFTNNVAQQGAIFGITGASVQMSQSNATGNEAIFGSTAYVFTSGNLAGNSNIVDRYDLSTASGGFITTQGQFSQVNISCPSGTVPSNSSQGQTCITSSSVTDTVSPSDNQVTSIVSPTSSSSSSSSSSTGAIIGGVVGGVAFLLLIGVIVGIILMRRARRRQHGPEMIPMDLNIKLVDKAVVLKWSEMKDFQKVGQGAFGVVYSVQWRGINAAVKQVINQSTLTQQNLDEFLGEESHVDISEFCPAGSLHTFLNKSVDLDYDTKFKFIKGIALGMVHLSAEKIVHRDLAARNVLLTEHLEPKISDFGMSRLTETEDNAGQTQSMVGPIKWMAPEGGLIILMISHRLMPFAAISQRKYSTKSDVFSFGVVVWEICTQSEPWAGIAPVNAAVDILAGQRLIIPDDVPSQFSDIMQNCWVESPEDRPDFLEICDHLKIRSDVKKENKPVEEVPTEIVDPEAGTNYSALVSSPPRNRPLQPSDSHV